MITNIERAGGTGIADIARRGVLERAPAWWRQMAERGIPPATKPVQPPQASKPKARPAVIGWLAGVCCPGVSKPCYGTTDGKMLPEQFTPRAMQSMLDQVRSLNRNVPLTYGHGGPVLATTRGLDLVFGMDRTCGIEFEARLRDTADCRKVLDLIGMAGMGVSIGYTKPTQWIVERDGIGPVRIIDDCVLDHVAVVEKDTNRRAAYVAARCYGIKGSPWACPSSVRDESRAWAFRFLYLQSRGQ